MVYGLRSAQRYPHVFRDYLRRRYQTAQYKLPLFSLFMERAIELLKPNGVMGFITPDSYLLGKYYSKLREYLLKHTRILNLSLLGFEPFRSTLGHTAVSFFQKTQAEEKKTNRVITRWIKFPEEITLRTWQEYWVKQADFYATPLKRFHLFFSEEAANLVKTWHEKNPSKLSDFVTIHTGIRSKIGQKNIISSNKKGPNWKKGIISGKQVTPFSVKWEGHFGFMPVYGTYKENLEWVKRQDMKAIDLISRLKAKEFYKFVVENELTICGFIPITLVLLIMKKLGAKKGKLIKYATSYDVYPDSSFVTYAGVVFS